MIEELIQWLDRGSRPRDDGKEWISVRWFVYWGLGSLVILVGVFTFSFMSAASGEEFFPASHDNITESDSSRCRVVDDYLGVPTIIHCRIKNGRQGINIGDSDNVWSVIGTWYDYWDRDDPYLLIRNQDDKIRVLAAGSPGPDKPYHLHIWLDGNYYPYHVDNLMMSRSTFRTYTRTG